MIKSFGSDTLTSDTLPDSSLFPVSVHPMLDLVFFFFNKHTINLYFRLIIVGDRLRKTQAQNIGEGRSDLYPKKKQQQNNMNNVCASIFDSCFCFLRFNLVVVVANGLHINDKIKSFGSDTLSTLLSFHVSVHPMIDLVFFVFFIKHPRNIQSNLYFRHIMVGDRLRKTQAKDAVICPPPFPSPPKI